MELTHPRRPVDGSDAHHHVFAIAKRGITASGGVGTAMGVASNAAQVSAITRHSEGVQALALGSADSLSY